MNEKISLEKPATLLSPVPAVMVSCGNGDEANIITIAWTGIVNSNPPMVSISVRKERFSHHLLMQEKEFVINLPTQEQVETLDWVGVKSGRDVNKWKERNLTKGKAEKVSCPVIAECPVNLECKVTQVLELGSHDLFLAEIVNVQVQKDLMDTKGALHMERAHLVALNHGKYYPVPRVSLLRMGESVMKPSTAKKQEKERKAKRRTARGYDKKGKKA